MTSSGEIQVAQHEFVTVITIERPPHNHIDAEFISRLADTLDELDTQAGCRAVVLEAGGKSFCAGVNLSEKTADRGSRDLSAFYLHAMRLFRTRKPIVAAVHGAAIGAGLGLALVADFRVTCPAARFSANFNRLGFHPGFGLSFSLPRLIGEQNAALLFYTGRRIDGAQAVAMGLADELVADGEVGERALALAQEIAGSAPLAVQTTRATLRQALADQVQAANQRELTIQMEQFATADFKEGVAAMAERRTPAFTGR